MDYYKKLGTLAATNNTIRQEQYQKYKVKRGLRNSDGSGVLVGLTTVSSVIGYEKIDEEIVPMDGRLYYRGLDVKDFISGHEDEQRFGFEEAIYLLLFGQLPKGDELQLFRAELNEMMLLPINFARDVLQTFRTPDIMNALSRSVLTLYSSDEEADNLMLTNQIRQGMNLAAKMISLVPYAYYSIQQAFHGKSLIIHQPDPNLSFAENFLHLLRTSSEFTDLEAKTLDTALVLHADHGGGNNSTFTARVVSSTLTDFYSAMAASLGSLRGPLHGGANVKAILLMQDLAKNVSGASDEQGIKDYLWKVLHGKAFDLSGKIYGIGHAVYTKSDPRAVILKKYAERMAKEKGVEEDFALLDAVERIAPELLKTFKNNPDLVVSANVDFYSGFIYQCLDIPQIVFTPIFAMARMAGWSAHRIELLSNDNRIMRPAYKSLTHRSKYISLNERISDPDI